MFTGLIQAVGQLTQINTLSAGMQLYVFAPVEFMAGVQLGDSICVQGVCLTVTEYDSEGFAADVSQETLDCSTFKNLDLHSLVNLEKSLTLQSALGGHLVSGHVDGLARICAMKTDGDSVRFTLCTEPDLAKFIARKGSVCLDGVSLTVNQVNAEQFDVNIIPHTMKHTSIQHWRCDQWVNIEVDLLARYAERILEYQKPV